MNLNIKLTSQEAADLALLLDRLRSSHYLSCTDGAPDCPNEEQVYDFQCAAYTVKNAIANLEPINHEADWEIIKARHEADSMRIQSEQDRIQKANKLPDYDDERFTCERNDKAQTLLLDGLPIF